VINLPSTACTYFTAAHDEEKERIFPETASWISVTSREEYERRYPDMPARIVDNLLKPEARISVVSWETVVADPQGLAFMIDTAFRDRFTCEYNLSTPMRRSNS
jgi:hypothetical protein